MTIDSSIFPLRQLTPFAYFRQRMRINQLRQKVRAARSLRVEHPIEKHLWETLHARGPSKSLGHRYESLLIRQVIKLARGLQRPQHPVRTASPVG